MEILEYFVRNPRAADTIEGVARWRLLDQTVHRAVDETHEALHWLVAQGFLCQSTTASAGTIFTLNPEKETQALRFLRGGTGPEGAGEAPETDEDGGGKR